MNRIEKYELSKAQIEACKRIERAFASAKKLGVVFLAKQYDIMAYRNKALKHAVPLDRNYSQGPVIPYYSLKNCIDDSGADDMEHFPEGFLDE